MKTTEKQASKRLFKKLSALRATLSNEERKILDNIIVDEAVAHRIDLSKNAEVNANQMKFSKIATKNAGKNAEVSANQMKLSKIATKNAGKIATKNAEVNANQMKVGKIATKNAGKIAGRVATKIIFDPNSEEYKISE